jgi:CheY-like chemotaxis protein
MPKGIDPRRRPMDSRGVAQTVLIVDDNRATRDALRAVLSTKGYGVAEAASGTEALDYLRRGGEAASIILDLHMPGMSGHEVHEELKRDPALANIPVVVFSALDDDGRLRGVVAYVRKAVDPDVLLRALERACGPVPSPRRP